MGDTWQTNPSCKPNTPVVISEGWCVSPGRKRPKQKWSHCLVCSYYEEAPRMGFVVCGIGELVRKYVDYTDDMESKFMADVTNFYCKVAKMMKLKHVNRETITERIDAIMASSPRQT